MAIIFHNPIFELVDKILFLNRLFQKLCKYLPSGDFWVSSLTSSVPEKRLTVLDLRTRRHLFGILVIAVALIFAGAAVAGTASPLQDGAQVQEAKMPEFIKALLAPKKEPEVAKAEPKKEKKPVKAAAVKRKSPAKPAAKRISKEAEAEKVVAIVEEKDDPAKLPSNIVINKQPSLFSRVISFGSLDRLSDENAARYAHIFAFQDSGDFARANAEIEKLTDDRLLGHVLAQRYLSAKYKATGRELADWMKAYADHAGAQKVYDLARKRQPKGATIMPPHAGRGVYALYDFDVGQLATPYLGERRQNPKQRDVVRAVDNAVSGSPTLALKRLDNKKDILNDTQYDSLRANIAASYFYNDKPEKARDLATASAGRSGHDVPLANWISGLTAWKQGDYAAAAGYFEATANSQRTSAWMAAAGAHWAARSYLRSHRPQKVSYWLHRAAEYPRTFYGIISMKALGMEQAKFNWNVPELSDRHVKALSTIPAGRRALALIDAERPDLAEHELSQMNPGDDAVLQEAMLALSTRNGMPGLSLRMGSSFKGQNGKLYDAALYPDAPWEPRHGFSVDKALVYAFIRQESRFRPDWNNRSSGATGLMQLMPKTAKHVAKMNGDTVEAAQLQDPMVNIDLGQKYLSELLKNEYVENNLFKLAVAYNAGPGKLARWEANAHYADDPLLFIESIPVAETRIFVERVLTNYWIYRIKFQQDTTSLDKVAEGEWPVYTAQDDRRGTVFAAAENIFSR
jgi:soluble lytic murein transglycosylase